MARRTRVIGAVLVVLALIAVAACGSQGSQPPVDGRVTVAVAFYPLQEAVERIGGDRIDVVDLTPPGGEPHDLELSPHALAGLEHAEAVVYLSRGFQPAVEKAVAELPRTVRKLDVLRGIDLLKVTPGLSGTHGPVDGEKLQGGFDPHVWVDPLRQAKIAASVQRLLSALDPAYAKEYASAATAYIAGLNDLSEGFAAGLKHCESRTIVTSHRAFAYLSERYDLEQIPIAGISPDDEPDPRSLAAVAREAKADHVKVIFFESTVPKDLAETIAHEIGATTDSLDPVETITQPDLDKGIDYSTVQRSNLKSLERALRCHSDS
jgi:zinc transport system substrate-binding protein